LFGSGQERLDAPLCVLEGATAGVDPVAVVVAGVEGLEDVVGERLYYGVYLEPVVEAGVLGCVEGADFFGLEGFELWLLDGGSCFEQ
jgi:hypothetical protein